MPDQSPHTFSDPDSPRSFRIPTRPAMPSANEQNTIDQARETIQPFVPGPAVEPGNNPAVFTPPANNWQNRDFFQTPQASGTHNPAQAQNFSVTPAQQNPSSIGSLEHFSMPAQNTFQVSSGAKTEQQNNSLGSFERTRQANPWAGIAQQNSVPPQPPAAISHFKKRQRAPLIITLAILAVLVVVGGLFGPQLLNNAQASNANTPLNFSGAGPYAQFPLSASQINNIQHLSGHMKYKALANLYVSHMNLDDKIGQLIMTEYNQESYSSDLDYMINTLHVGGVIMYEFQMTSASQTKNDIAQMQARANIPLLISTDEEGGPYVHRLSNIYGYRMSATQIEETGDVNVATQQGLKTSQDLAALGINEDLAPDVDVNQVNGYDMVTRTFGNTAADVIKYAGAYLQAMQGNGTVACIKHFPGLGGALTDAHTGLPVVNSTKQQIYDVDLAPFKNFIQSSNALQNPGMIMPTDVLLPAIDVKYPAELSYAFMTQILRNEFGYDGVSLTDALYMKGITDTWSMDTAAVMALQAGNDMLLGANGTQQTIDMINAIKQALLSGQLTQARVDESVTRIIALKMQYHLMPTYVPGA